jgi:hypothetical protein
MKPFVRLSSCQLIWGLEASVIFLVSSEGVSNGTAMGGATQLVNVMRRQSESTAVPCSHAIDQACRAAAAGLSLSGINGVVAVSLLAGSRAAGLSVERAKRGGGRFAGLSD